MWTPRYNAKFIRPIRANIRAFFEKHEADALKWANDDQVMEAFAVYRNALWYNTLRPVCSVVSQHSDVSFSDDLSRIDQKHTVYVEIEDQGPDPDLLAESVERRVQACDMMVRSAVEEEWLGDLNKDYMAFIEIDVSDHDYLQFQRNKTVYLQTGSFTVTVATLEMLKQ